MRFRRTTLVANVVIIGATLPAVGLPVAASSSAALPLYEYVSAGATNWSTQALAGQLGGHLILGSAHAVAGDGEFALAARLENGDLGLFVRNASGTSSFHDVSSISRAPAAGADPNVFLDPWGNVDVIYVSTNHRLVMISTANARSPRHANVVTRTSSPARSPAYDVTDLTVASHVAMSPGLPSVSVSGLSAEIFDRSTKGDAIAIPLGWHQLSVAPIIGAATNVTLATKSPTVLNDPVAMPATTNAFAATTSYGHVEFFTQAVAGASPWVVTDVTALDSSPASVGQLAMATSGPQIYLASLASSGHVQLFSIASSGVASLTLGISARIVPHITNRTPSWKYGDLTAVIAGSPLWVGHIFLSATATSVSVAGRAASWGDIYDYSSALPSGPWTSSDVSLDAGASTAAATGVTGVLNGNTLQLFATSSGTRSLHGVGVYAIPSNDWGRAIFDGWPIISETGGLGTLTAPWVGASSSSVTRSSDYQMAQSILNSQKRETWLSFWTVSGPLTPATQTTASYYSHGFLAGQWVAQQIDQYHLHGVGIKPNWVILDPEGFPDNHSALDAPAGASPATIKKHATYWSAMLSGWSAGITDVDPGLHPGVYASQSEYRNYGIANSTLPVFEAIAFGGGGPLRIAGSNGHNILGYIAFNAACTPAVTLHAQEHTLLNPPWSGQFNTLQFNAGVYCAP